MEGTRGMDMNSTMSLDVFDRKPYHRTFFGELERAFWLSHRKQKIEKTDHVIHSFFEDAYKITNDEYEKKVQSEVHKIVLGEEMLSTNRLCLNNMYMYYIDIWIKILGGGRVLEIGSGRGRSLFGLTQLNPKLKLTGLERSHQGILRSKEKQQEMGSAINFVEGDARELPFEDNSFDIVFTIHSLKSLTSDYKKVIPEMARVAKYGIFVENFREAQSLVDLMWLRQKNRFRYSHRAFNMDMLYFTKDIPHKPKCGMGFYVGKFKKE